MPKILIVEDEQNTRENLKVLLKKDGYEILEASNGKEALQIIEKYNIDLILSDLMMPEMDGIELLEALGSDNQNIPTIIITGHGSIPSAVDAMKKGAFDYQTKPINFDELEIKVKKALEKKIYLINQNLLKSINNEKANWGYFIGKSREAQHIIEFIDIASRSDTTVLIQGETGTGKELVARLIHINSDRRDRQFIYINCSSIPDTLIESELFGHEKGAFTGAIRKGIGRFELADGGTLFLDEVGDIPLNLQIKLLRVLQYREFERIGSGKTIHVDSRIITATNRNLKELIEKGRFRDDLYYRLNVLPIYIPPLRDRRDDIIPLADYFVTKYSKRWKRAVKLGDDIIKFMTAYHWPGNVRELENMIERGMVLDKDGILSMDDILIHGLSEEEIFSPKTANNNYNNGFKKSVDGVWKETISKALIESGGDKEKAANLLNMSRATFYRKLRLHEIAS